MNQSSTSNTVACLACKHEYELGAGPPAEHSVLVCKECDARMPYGRLAPIVVVEPFVDDRAHAWVRYRIQDPVTHADLYFFDLDPQHSAMMSKAGLSLVIP